MSIKRFAIGGLLIAAAATSCWAQGNSQKNANPAPGFNRVELPVVSPAESERQIRSRVMPKNLNQGFTGAGGSGGGGAAARSSAAPVAVTSSIPELARALTSAGPNGARLSNIDQIYEYVRNTIEFDPGWGLQKGALGALIDSRGNAFDQAALMVMLAREQGYTASFIRGTIKLSAAQAGTWLGVSTANACAVVKLVASGGMPVSSNPAVTSLPCTSNPGPLVELTIGHVWVKVNVGGTNYFFDPSYKPHTLKSIVNLATASGYSASSFLTSAVSGATVTADYAQLINRTNVRSNLTTYSNALANTLRQTYPAAKLEDIVGGMIVTPHNGTQLRLSQLSQLPGGGTTYLATTQIEEWTLAGGDVPSNYKSVLSLNYSGIVASATSDTIYGRRLTLNFNGSGQPQLWIEGSLAAVGTVPAQGATASFSVTHPYSGANQTFPQSVTPGGTYFISNGWGPVTRGLVEYMRAGLDTAKAAGNSDTSEPVLGATLGVLAATWMAQTNQANFITGRLSQTNTIYHHQIGLAGHNSAPYVDLPGNLVSTASEVADAGKESAAFFSMATRNSVFESTTVRQTTGANAVSTVTLIDQASSANQKIFNATSANYASIKTQQTGCASYEATFQERVNAGARLIMPTSCALNQQSWTGTGYYDILTSGGSTGIGAIISGGLAGGFATTTQPVTTTVSSVSTAAVSERGLTQSSGTAWGDPIDMVKGSYLYSRNDFSTGVGEFPYSLSLQRLYSSGARYSAGPLGLGWTHNFAVSVAEGSDGFQALGEDSALDAVAALVEQMVTIDLMSDANKPVDKMVIATLAQAWLGEQLVNNTAIVRQGLNGEVFVKLPNGSFNPPPGSPAKLTVSSNLYSYETLNKAVLAFDSSKRLSTYTEPSGIQAKFTYTGNDLTQVQNNLGRTLTLGYTSGRITSVTDGNSRTAYYGYDASGNLKTFTDTAAKITTFQYDVPGRMIKLFYPAKQPDQLNPTVPYLTNVYDTLGRVKEQTNANNKLYQYFFAGNRSEEFDPKSGSKVTYLDDRGKVTKSIDAVGRVTTNTYDGHSRVLSTTLPEGNRVDYTYDDVSCAPTTGSPAGQARCTHNVKTVTRVAKAGSGLANLLTSFSYETQFNKVSVAIDPRNQSTNFTYTAQGLPLTVQSPADNNGVQPLSTFGYTSYTVGGFPTFYLQTSVTQRTTSASATVVSATSYNSANKYVPSTTVVDSGSGKLNLTSTLTYDAIGNLTQVNGPRLAPVQDITTFEYDTERRRTKVINPKNEQTRFAYDADGRLIRTSSSLDPDFVGYWKVTCTTYTLTGKPQQSVGPGFMSSDSTCPTAAAPTPVVSIDYDDLDRAMRTTQALTTAEGGNRVTETDYFADDRVQAVRRAVGSSVAQTYSQFTYTTNGLLATLKDARNYLTTYEYDGHDRRFKVRFPDKTTINTSSTTDYEQYGFDANGNVTSIRRRDAQNITLGYDNLNRLLTRTYPLAADNVTFGYDLLNRRTSANKGDGHNVSYVWDNAGRLTSTQAGTRTLSYLYDEASNRTRITWPDGGFAQIYYDELSRPITIKESDVFLLASYTYYPTSLRKTVTLGNGTTTTYGYNTQFDLSQLSHDLTDTASDAQFTYTRNQAREVTQITNINDTAYLWKPPATANGTKNYTANGQNQYATITGASPSYDARGNLQGDGIWTYGYDPDNRLKTANKTGYAATLVYDAEGRMRQTVLAGTTTDLLYDGPNLVAEYNNTGAITKRYVHGPGIDEPIVAYDGGGATKTWLYADHLGSVIAQADSSGASTATYKYGPFGDPDTTSGIRFRYTGQQYIAGLDLYHYKARFYSHAQGRFLQTDPIGTLDDNNLYGYVRNSPVNLVDSTGLCPLAVDGVPCRAIYPFAGVSITSERLRAGLDAIAAAADRNLIVYSGDRDPARNAQVGGARNSAHTQGIAADVIFQGMSKAETAATLYNSTARIDAGIRLVYHRPGSPLPEHSHLDLIAGPNIQQNPGGAYSPVSVLPTHLPSHGYNRLDVPVASSSDTAPASNCTASGCNK